jgi:Leucine-rich repeat (LRR) protein
MYFDIQSYLNSFPEDTKELQLDDKKITYLPDLSRFKVLEYLDCSHNKLTVIPELPSTLKRLECLYNILTVLPELPSTLEYLDCSHNKMMVLPELPSTLEYLDCSYNKWTVLPELPSTLKQLKCSHNKMTVLPKLPSTLKTLYCSHTRLIFLPDLPSGLHELFCRCTLYSYNYLYTHEDCIYINNINKKLKNFHFLFYCLKFKHKFRHWLWDKVRRPKIEAQFHPSRIQELLEKGVDIEDLDAVLDVAE